MLQPALIWNAGRMGLSKGIMGSQVDVVSLVQVARPALQEVRGAVRQRAGGAAAAGRAARAAAVMVVSDRGRVQGVELQVGRGAQVVEEHAPAAAAARQQVVQEGQRAHPCAQHTPCSISAAVPLYSHSEIALLRRMQITAEDWLLLLLLPRNKAPQHCC